MTCTPSAVYKLSLSDWERIAFYVVASETSLLGPPSGLCALSLVSRRVHDAVSLKYNSRLYARIFRFKFDYAAPARRLSPRWLTSRCLASELIKRFTVLKRVRANVELNVEELWTCYLMMSESDGKNESQLIEWACLPRRLESAMVSRIHAPRSRYADVSTDSLLIWLMWMTISRASIRTEQPGLNQLMIQILHPFIATGYRMPSTYAPDSYFVLPVCSEATSIVPHCSGPPPPHGEIIHYSHRLTVAAPMAISAALLVRTVRTEAIQDFLGLPQAALRLPANRETATALNLRGPTLQDITEFHFLERIHVPERCAPTTEVAFEDDEEICEEQDIRRRSDLTFVSHKNSERYDEDWSRLVACYDPQFGSLPLRSKVFSLGSLSGSWRGRIMIPGFDAHLSVILNPQLSPLSIPLHSQPLYWTLQEHHCLDPHGNSLSPGIGDVEDDDFLNAWLPRGIIVNRLDDAIEIIDPSDCRSKRYETFNPRGTIPYSAAACDKVERPWISDLPDEGMSGTCLDSVSGTTDPDPSVSYIDDDDEYEDVVRHKSSGVCDILITGEPDENRGAAWGHFNIIGRVRPWDGLVVLVRTPRDQDQEHSGRWVFKGYLHDRNLVGRWRGTSTPVGMTGFEGGFVVCRQN